MGRRSHARKDTANNSESTRVQNQAQSRPFAIQAQTASVEREQQELPDLQTQLEAAKQFGHHFAGTTNPASNATSTRPSQPFIQPKLTIGAVGDKYEQEADRVATQVVEQLNSSPAGQSSPNQTLQRESLPEDEELQMKPAISQIQQQESAEKEDEELQMKPEASIQRQESVEEEDQEDPDDKLQMKPEASVQRQEAVEEEGEELQMRPLLQRQENVGGSIYRFGSVHSGI